MIGTRIGKYEVVAVLGEGVHCTSYLVAAPDRHQRLVLKLVREEASEGARARFGREAHIALNLLHPHIVRSVDAAHHGQDMFLVQELVEGETLRVRLGRGPCAEAEVLAIARQLLAALDAVHRAGLVHRDIRPENLFVERASGTLKLSDLALARPTSQERSFTERSELSLVHADYVSPEMIREHDLDIRSDLYSAGVVIYECLVGRPPFHARTTVETIRKHCESPVPAVAERRPGTGAALGGLVEALLQKDKRKRPETPADALARLGTASTPAVADGEVSLPPRDPDSATSSELPIPWMFSAAPGEDPTRGLVAAKVEGAGRTLFLYAGRSLGLGREPRAGAWVCLRNRPSSNLSMQISREHLVVAVTGREVTLTDRGSKRGTTVEGARLKPNAPTPLTATRRVSVGGALDLEVTPIPPPDDAADRSPAVWLRRVADGVEHGYALVPHRVLLAVDAAGAPTPGADGTLDVVAEAGVLWVRYPDRRVYRLLAPGGLGRLQVGPVDPADQR